MREIQAYDIMNDGKLTNALLVILCFLLLIFLGLLLLILGQVKNVNREEIIDFAIGKLAELKIKADFEDRDRKKIRYVKKSQAYQDLINLLKGMKYYE